MALTVVCALCGCSGSDVRKSMVVIAPGHFHASLIQKDHLEGVSDTVKVYAPEGKELDAYLATVESFNSRAENPTCWVEETHSGEAWLEGIPAAPKGGFAVLAGKNGEKSDYILAAVRKGYHVLSDKPMAIGRDGYATLTEAYSLAAEKGLVVFDMMTERYDVMNILVREMVADKDFFGEFDGAVSVSSVHHFFKEVAGAVLKRPAWYYDVRQQGEGIADVTTHLIDLVFWQCFPDEAIEVRDIKLTGARHYPTEITLEQYQASTGEDSFPDYLAGDLKDGKLQVMANGSISFSVKGLPVTIDVRWDYEAPKGTSDTSESVYEGTGATVRILQDESTGFERRLLVSAADGVARAMEAKLKRNYPFISFKEYGDGEWQVAVPKANLPGHEELFNITAKHFLGYMDHGRVPGWESTNTLTKYYLTTEAVEMACSE